MNPFRSGIVASPWESTAVDVSTIHQDVFEQCVGAIQQVQANHASAGLLVHGEAGSGKTHLLRRLRTFLTPQKPSATERPETLYAWIRLQTSPRMIWRSLRRSLVEDWFRPVRGTHNQFQRILFHRFAEVRPAAGDLELWYEYMLENDPDGLQELLDLISDAIDLDRNTAVAFEHIAFGRHVRDLRAWLSGDSLPEAVLDRLDLTQDEETDEQQEDRARQVVLMLCRLAGTGLPIVISFDQVEALQTAPADRDALFAFGQAVSALHDSTNNVLLVSCVQSAFFNELRDHARRADYDRMSSLGAWSLHPLTREQCLDLIQARLRQLDLAELLEIPQTPGWPLDSGEFEALFAKDSAISPRKLLNLCAERFESWLKRGTIDPTHVLSDSDVEDAPGAVLLRQQVPADNPTDAFIQQEWESRFDHKQETNRAERTEEIIRHGLPMLVRLLLPGMKTVTDELLPDVSLVFEAPAGRIGLSFCTLANMTSLAHRLRRLKAQQSSRRLQRLVIIRDNRIPLSRAAKKARETLDELEQQQAVVVHPSIESLAALDALRDLMSDAKSGDLLSDGTAIRPETLEQWLSANLTSGLRDLVRTILGSDGRSSMTPISSHARSAEALNS